MRNEHPPGFRCLWMASIGIQVGHHRIPVLDFNGFLRDRWYEG